MSRVEVTYFLSEAQFMHAARVLWAYRAIGNTGNWILAILAAAAGPALLLNGLQTGWLFIAAAIFFVTLTLLREAIWRRAYRKMAKYSGTITAGFSATHVSTRSVEGESDLPWATFKNYAETPEFYFLFLGRRGLSIIPKSAFGSDEDLEQVRMHIASNLKRKKMRWT